jgi:nicotinate-nucleotide--dimethylbenzimidazole phosphoribosyltransferase
MNTPRISSLSDLRAILLSLPGPDRAAREKAIEREPHLTKPKGSLGRLEELAAWLAAWQGRHPPVMDRPAAATFAGNHGVMVHKVSPCPVEVTWQQSKNFAEGGGAINAMCRSTGTEFKVYDVAIASFTRDFLEGPAMDEDDFVSAFNVGMAAVDPGMSVFCPGEMGIGNTTPASAMAMALYGGSEDDWVGYGAGAVGPILEEKKRVVREGVARHIKDHPDAVEIARRLGGRELAAMAGATLAARLLRVPVLLDGFPGTAAVAFMEAFQPGALDHCRVSHASAEAGHAMLCERLRQRPLLRMGMRLGEGTGGVLAVNLLRAAVVCHTEMATYEEAAVARNER